MRPTKRAAKILPDFSGGTASPSPRDGAGVRRLLGRLNKNMDKIIIFLFSILVFILIIKAETSTSHFKRQKFIFAYLLIAILEIVIGFIFIHGRIDRVVFVFSFIAFVFYPPFLISHIINFFKHKDKPYFFTLSNSLKIFDLIATISWLLIIGINIFSPKGMLLSDFDNFSDYFFYSYGNSLLAIVVIYFFLSDAFQVVKIYEEGFFFRGVLWKWSDFHSFSITADTKNKNIQKVTLNLAKNIWIPIDDIFLSIAAENGEKLNAWLSQRLPHA